MQQDRCQAVQDSLAQKFGTRGSILIIYQATFDEIIGCMIDFCVHAFREGGIALNWAAPQAPRSRARSPGHGDTAGVKSRRRLVSDGQ
jgi:hypothetical protein